MTEINKQDISGICQTPDHVLAYIIKHADMLQKTLSAEYNLKTIAQQAMDYSLDGDNMTALHQILTQKSDLITAIVIGEQKKLENDHERAISQDYVKRDPQYWPTRYNIVKTNKQVLDNLFTVRQFLGTGDYAFFSWAIATPEERNIIKELLIYESLSPRGGENDNKLPENQRFGYKNNAKFLLTKNEHMGTLTSAKIGLLGS